MATAYEMKVSGNGQVSIPADVRSRWASDRVVIVDLGDRIVLRPLPQDPVAQLRGKYRGRGASADEVRRIDRHAELVDENQE